MSNRTEKLRAIFLTVVMFGSVLALGAMAAAPAAAAPPAQEDVGADIPSYTVSNPGAFDIAVADGGSASNLPSELQDDFTDSEVEPTIDDAIGALGSQDTSILVTKDESEDSGPAVNIDNAPAGSLTIASYDGPDSTTIEGTGGTQTAIDINLDSSTDLTIQGFTINGDNANVIDVQSQLNSLTLTQNDVTASNNVDLLKAKSAIGSLTLGYNTFDGGDTVATPAVDFFTTIDEVDVNNNVFKNIEDTAALQFQGASDVTIQSNDFFDIGDEAVFAATDDSSATGTYQISQNNISDVAGSDSGEDNVFGFYATGSAFSADITIENNVGDGDVDTNGGIVSVEADGADVTSESITIQDNGFSDVDPGSGASDAVFDFDSGANTFNDAGDISVTDVTIADNNVSASAGGGPFVNVAESDDHSTTIDSLAVSNSGNTVYDGGDNGVSGIVVGASNGAVDSVTVDGVSFADLGTATALDLSGDGTTTATVTDLTVDGIADQDVINLNDASLTSATLNGVDAANVSSANGLEISAVDPGSQNFDLTLADTFTVDGVADDDKAGTVVNFDAPGLQSNIELTNLEASNVTNGVDISGDVNINNGFQLDINNVEFTDVGSHGVLVSEEGIGDLSISGVTVTLDGSTAAGLQVDDVTSSAAQTSVSVTGVDVTGSQNSADGVIVDLSDNTDDAAAVASLVTEDITVTDVGASGVVYGTNDVGDGTVSLSSVSVDNFGSNSDESGVALIETDGNTLDEVAVDATAINNSGTGAAIDVQGSGDAVQANTLTLNGSEASSNGDSGTGISVQVDGISTVVADSVTANDNSDGIVIGESGGTQDATVNITNANIADNGNNGIDADVSGTLTLDVEDGSISDNGADAVQFDKVDENSVIDLSRNYWGNVTGPSIEDNGNALTASETRYANGGLIDDQGADGNAQFDVRPFLDADGNEVYAFDGEVEDADNNALSGEDVTIEYEGVNTASSGSYTFQGTSATGEFVAVIDDFESTDQFEASASVTGFGPSDTQSFSITGDAYVTDRTSTRFTLTQGATLEGTINDSSGNAVANVDNLELINADTGDVIINGFSTNLQGEYSVSFSPGTYDLRVNHPDFDSSDATEGVELTSGNTTTADFALKQDTTATLTATVQNASAGGTALADTEVTFSTSDSPPSSNDASLPVTKTTDSSGQVTVEIPADESNQAYNIVVSADGFEDTTRGVAPAPGDSLSRTYNMSVEEGADETTLARFDSGDDGTIDRDEAVDAIVAFNEGSTIGGEEVTRDQAVQVIIAFNEGQTVAA